MAKILGQTIPCLVHKKTAAGVRFYWQPSAALKREGWKAVALGGDMKAAIAAAEAQNARIEEWRTGGAKPRAVKRYIERASVAALVAAYKRDEKFTRLADNTRRTYT